MGRVQLRRGWVISSKVLPVLMIHFNNCMVCVQGLYRDIFQIVQLFHLDSYTLNNYWGFDHFSPPTTNLLVIGKC